MDHKIEINDLVNYHPIFKLPAETCDIILSQLSSKEMLALYGLSKNSRSILASRTFSIPTTNGIKTKLFEQARADKIEAYRAVNSNLSVLKKMIGDNSRNLGVGLALVGLLGMCFMLLPAKIAEESRATAGIILIMVALCAFFILTGLAVMEYSPTITDKINKSLDKLKTNMGYGAFFKMIPDSQRPLALESAEVEDLEANERTRLINN